MLSRPVCASSSYSTSRGAAGQSGFRHHSSVVFRPCHFWTSHNTPHTSTNNNKQHASPSARFTPSPSLSASAAPPATGECLGNGYAGADCPYGPTPRGRCFTVLGVCIPSHFRGCPGAACFPCGLRLIAPIRSIDELKSWVSRHSSVPLQHMVALTPQGRSVKSASLHAEVGTTRERMLKSSQHGK